MKREKEREKREEREVIWFLGSCPKQVEVPNELHPSTRYVAGEADGAGGFSLPSRAGLVVLRGWPVGVHSQ